MDSPAKLFRSFLNCRRKKIIIWPNVEWSPDWRWLLRRGSLHFRQQGRSSTIGKTEHWSCPPPPLPVASPSWRAGATALRLSRVPVVLQLQLEQHQMMASSVMQWPCGHTSTTHENCRWNTNFFVEISLDRGYPLFCVVVVVITLWEPARQGGISRESRFFFPFSAVRHTL